MRAAAGRSRSEERIRMGVRVRVRVPVSRKVPHWCRMFELAGLVARPETWESKTSTRGTREVPNVADEARINKQATATARS